MIDKQVHRTQFEVGETIRIKSSEEISKLIGGSKRTDGCVFMDQMFNYCGKTFPVAKVVNYVFSEHQKRTFKPRSNLYILNNLLCDGKVNDFHLRCDRSCFFLWHEEWLEKID